MPDFLPSLIINAERGDTADLGDGVLFQESIAARHRLESGPDVILGQDAQTGGAGAGLGESMLLPADLLLHMDGGEGSGTFTDSSWNPKTVTANGGMVQRTTAAVFGASGGRFDGVDDYLSLADDPAWDILANGNDFFIECRVTFGTFPADYEALVVHFQDSNNRWLWYLNDTGSTRQMWFQVMTGGSPLYYNTGNVLTAGVLYVLAIERYNGTLYFYVDGVVVHSVALPSTSTFSGSLYIGQHPTGLNKLFADMDELIIRRSAGPRGQNYTPGVVAYTF